MTHAQLKIQRPEEKLNPYSLMSCDKLGQKDQNEEFVDQARTCSKLKTKKHF